MRNLFVILVCLTLGLGVSMYISPTLIDAREDVRTEADFRFLLLGVVEEIDTDTKVIVLRISEDIMWEGSRVALSYTDKTVWTTKQFEYNGIFGYRLLTQEISHENLKPGDTVFVRRASEKPQKIQADAIIVTQTS